jgi:hypothetical protein
MMEHYDYETRLRAESFALAEPIPRQPIIALGRGSHTQTNIPNTSKKGQTIHTKSKTETTRAVLTENYPTWFL